MGKDNGLSTRVKTKRRLSVVADHLRAANLGLGEIRLIYKTAHPVIGEACQVCVQTISMIETMVFDIRDQL